MPSYTRVLSVLLVSSCSLACGGRASSSGAPPDEGSAGAAGTSSAAEPLRLDDAFPWFTASGEGHFPPGQTDEILHLAASGPPARAVLSTHNHSDVLQMFEAVAFSARASEGTVLLASLSNTIQPFDYFEAREAGQPWPVAPVAVTPEWQDFTVRFDEMKPPELSDADGVPSFFLAFIVEQPSPVDVWLDDVRFQPKRPR